MLSRLEVRLRRLRRLFSRSVWLSRLFKLPVSEGPPTRPGMLMLQIDGLSQPQLERALRRGEMPFLQRLLMREHYRIHPFYSGLPSTTPAVQAELFYGIKGAVPAFAYKDRQSGRIVRLYEPEAAARVEANNAAEGDSPLLEGGSAYVDIFTGGAAESHFCPASMGWGPTMRSANPLVLLIFVLSNFYSFLRIGALLLIETGLALMDFVRGLRRGQDFIKELKFIPTRVAIAILLRELCVIGGKIDLSRGLPIIHINLLGYDEQSHRRGPRSLFAHWTLKGIDDAIARLWRAAHHAPWRHYEVWIYSDHGQAKTRTYLECQGYSLEKAVSEAFKPVTAHHTEAHHDRHVGSVQTQRVRFLGGTRLQRLFSVLGVNGDSTEPQQAQVASLGPVAHVYSPWALSSEERDLIAAELAGPQRIPVVLTVEAPGKLHARAGSEHYYLPQDTTELFGAQHPFIASLGEDLVRLCEHADAGDFVLLGWHEGIAPLTFATENGAHAGATPEETNGFALLPEDAPLPKRQHPYLRPTDLRNAVLHHLGRANPTPRKGPTRPSTTRTDTLRVVTYNVHSCIGMDGKIDAERIARVIARTDADVVALQELDVGRERSFGMDQAHLIAHYLEMEFHFHPAMHLEEERYGDAILSHLPLRLIKADSLPGLPDKPNLEPRGALWVAIEFNGREIQVLNTHLGLFPRERIAQVEALLGSEWLAHPQCRAPLILCGDLNATPSSPVYRRLGEPLRDAQAIAGAHRPRGTFSSRLPTLRIDHIFVSPDLEVTGVEIPDSQLAGVASDHLPLVAELRIPGRLTGSEEDGDT